MKKLSETDLAEKIVGYLEDMKWDVYQEVQPYSGSKCADIVAVSGPVAWVIECKLSAGLRVIEQAYEWKRDANMVSIAVPSSSRMARIVCKKLGVGIIHAKQEVIETARPDFIRKTSKNLREKLRPEHKTFAKAGNAGGGHWTPFKQTCLSVLRTVQRNPGISMKELVRKTETHYSSESSAKTCLAKWIDAGVVPGVEIRREGRRIFVYPADREISK